MQYAVVLKLLLESTIQLIHITVGPAVFGFGRGNHGMAGLVEVFPCMAVNRGIAAKGYPTGLTSAEVHPFISGFDTLFTFVRAFSSFEGFEVAAGFLFHDNFVNL